MENGSGTIDKPSESVVVKKSSAKLIPYNVFQDIQSITKKKIRTKVNHLMAYIVTNLDHDTFEYGENGEITVRGRHIPGSNLVKILSGMLTRRNPELGELLLLHLLAYAPNSIKRHIHKKKLAFINDEIYDATHYGKILSKHRKSGTAPVNGSGQKVVKFSDKNKASQSKKHSSAEHKKTKITASSRMKGKVTGIPLPTKLVIPPEKDMSRRQLVEGALKPKERIV